MPTVEERKRRFIDRARIIHNGENIDYSRVVYVNNRIPVELIDNDINPQTNQPYGVFWQSPCNHLKGQSHPLKKGEKIRKKKQSDFKNLIEEFNKVHQNENLDYSQSVFVNMHTKIKIISHDKDKDGNEYGEFWQEPIVHLKGCSHPKRAIDINTERQRSDTKTFVVKGKSIHVDDDYDYSLVNYVDRRTNVKIICNKTDAKGRKHGVFSITPDNFLQGKGCPKCGNHLSIAEDEISSLLSKRYGSNMIMTRNKTVLDGMELDIYIPYKKIAIEYDGLRWHSDKFKQNKYYHLNKTNACERRGITLIHVFEDEYLSNKSAVINNIFCVIDNVDQTINVPTSSEYIVKNITRDTAKDFLKQHHLQGFANASHHIGIYANEILVGVTTFKKWKDSTVIMNRFVVNGQNNASSILSNAIKYFLQNNTNVTAIIYFADRRWCSTLKNFYMGVGFNIVSLLPPKPYYTNGHGKRVPNWQNKKNDLRYDKIWDCGSIKYSFKNPFYEETKRILE